ncbi:MAG: hypothetical protein IJ174_06805 [Clostridia bacterium]|nr:hypothetical protein [Clostridia bacterium]
MKKLLCILLVLCFGISLASAEEAKTYDAGRISVVIPDGWTATPMDDISVMICKGIPFLSPMVTVSYYPLGRIFLDSRELYDSAADLEPFSLGGYDWTAYDVSSMGMDFTNATAETEYGTLVVSVTKKDAVSISDGDVQSILASIQITPFVTGDWFSVSEDGVLTVTLSDMDIYHWSSGGCMYSSPEEDSPEHETEVDEHTEDGVYTLTVKDATDGWYTQFLTLGSEAAAAGEAAVTAVISGGKITAVSDAILEMYDEPKVYDFPEYSPRTADDYVGAWFDKTSQRATLEITPLEDERFEILLSWSSSASETTEWRMTGAMDGVGDLSYQDGTKANVTYGNNGEKTSEETLYTNGEGWFTYTGEALVWTDFSEEKAYEFYFTRGE